MNSKIKILYVDDEEINVLLFNLNFSKTYDVLTSQSGFEGLELLKNNSDTRVIISDMKMPQMSGIEFIKKAKVLYPDIYFFILTGFDINDEIQEALNSKLIIQCFRKPVNMSELDNEIRVFLE